MFTTSADPGYPTGPHPLIIKIEFSSIFNFCYLFFYDNLSGPSKTTALPLKTFGCLGFDKYLSLNSLLITEVFMIADEKKLPFITKKPALSVKLSLKVFITSLSH